MITVNELFSGIGSQHAGMERLGIPYKIIGIAEIDKYAIKSYEAIHGPTRNYGDISKIEKLDYADFWTYSFPCQDISVAGKQRGITEETRSGLLYQVERLLEKSVSENEAPKWLMLENVKNLVGKKFKPDFDRWLHKLDKLGYNTYWKVLNSKDYGIPQNRERVYAISIRKDIDTGYAFPQPFELTKRLKDILEPEVDEKYYLDDEKVKLFMKNGNVNPSGNGMNGNVCTNDVCGTLTTNKGEGPKILQIGKINSSQDGVVVDPNGIAPTHTSGHGNCPKIVEPQCIIAADLNHYGNDQMNRVYDVNGISHTITVVSGGGREQKILEPIIAASRGRNTNNPSDRTTGAPTEQRLEINKNGTSNTITTVQKDNYVLEPSGIYTNVSERFNHGPLQGLSRCLKANKHDASVIIPQATKQGYIECKVGGIADLSFPSSATRRGRVQDNGNICPTLMAGQQDVCYIEPKPKLVGGIGEINFGKQFRQGNRIYSSEEVAMCLNAQPVGNAGGYSYLYEVNYRIRKLTPLECWRLMGFTDEQFYKAQAVNSNSQLYKQAGNSIVVDVLYWIFYQLFVNENKQQVIEEQDQLTWQMNIFDFIGG